MVRRREPYVQHGKRVSISMYGTLVQSGVIIALALLLTFLPPVYANGGHGHLGGIFFLLLVGVVFFGGVLVVFYFLLRPSSEETSDESDYD